MSQIGYSRPDNGSVLSSAVAAVLLIAAGLGLMLWDNYQDHLHLGSKSVVAQSAN